MHKTKREESWRRFIPLKSFEYLASDRKKLPPARRSNRSGGKTRSKLFERGKWKGRKAPPSPPPPHLDSCDASFQGLISRWFIFLQGVPMALPKKLHCQNGGSIFFFFFMFLCNNNDSFGLSPVEKSKHCIHGSRGNSEWFDNDGGGTDRYDRGNEGLVI